jgi:hypothetical protein
VQVKEQKMKKKWNVLAACALSALIVLSFTACPPGAGDEGDKDVTFTGIDAEDFGASGPDPTTF